MNSFTIPEKSDVEVDDNEIFVAEFVTNNSVIQTRRVSTTMLGLLKEINTIRTTVGGKMNVFREVTTTTRKPL